MRIMNVAKSVYRILFLLMLTSCAQQRTSFSGTGSLLLHRTATPIQLDGHVDKPVWQQAKPVRFDIPREFQQQGQSLEEGGVARLLWDDQYLYVAFDFT